MSATSAPHWLPALIPLTSDFTQDLPLLTTLFDRDFTQAAPTFLSIPVRWDARTVPGTSYCQCFWHIVTRNNERTRAREFDPPRARRLAWCAAVLANAGGIDVKSWDYKPGNKPLRTYAWLEAYDYVVVLEKDAPQSPTSVFLVTAYHVDGERSRKQLTRHFTNRVR